MTISSSEWRAWEGELDRIVTSIEKTSAAGHGEAMRKAIDAAEDALAKAASRVAELATKAELTKESVGRGRAEVERVIRDKPLPAVAVAAAAGFLLALLVRR